jgi:hypothetical protein
VTKESRLHTLERQIDRLQRCIVRLQRTSYRYTWLRIGVFGAGLLATALILYFAGPWAAGACLAVALLLFGLAVYAHQRVEHSIRRHRVWLDIKTAHVARASLDWDRIRPAFSPKPRPGHPFEADLDLVGGRSLHRLLDTAVSYEGSQRLRDWLTAPVPDPAATRRRQDLVGELIPRHRFRDRLTLHATLAARSKRAWQANDLVDWLARQGSEATLRNWLFLLGAWAVLNAVLLVANRLDLIPAWWMPSLVLYLGVWFTRVRATEAAWDEALALEGALRQLRAIFRQLETVSYARTPHLRALCAPFLDEAHRPSRYLARITGVVTAMGLRTNPLLGLALNAVVPWDAYFVYRLDRQKADMAVHAPAWMDVWFELEALGSLATFAYLNPGNTMPTVRGAGAAQAGVFRVPVFRAEGLGHPLLPDGERVCNDFSVQDLGQVTVITGSNMAGKSVFLKTVGLNLALAHAGGPVVARALETVPFRLFTSMGISDSVTDGISYFYAEVRRLKALLAELERDHPLPLLFCIDEIFRGTNNRERLLGSRAYVRALAGKNGLGLIATHDLELARLAEELPQVVNYHFRDRVVGDRMAFDYALLPGPCPTTNALTIMRLEGLPVPEGTLRDGRPDPPS